MDIIKGGIYRATFKQHCWKQQCCPVYAPLNYTGCIPTSSHIHNYVHNYLDTLIRSQ